jgi:hypothetical protein
MKLNPTQRETLARIMFQASLALSACSIATENGEMPLPEGITQERLQALATTLMKGQTFVQNGIDFTKDDIGALKEARAAAFHFIEQYKKKGPGALSADSMIIHPLHAFYKAVDILFSEKELPSLPRL